MTTPHDRFEPGDGWREVDRAPSREQRLALITNGVIDRMWAREAPVPPLPTEPGYYLAVEPGFGGTVVVELLGRPVGQWVDAGDRNYLEPNAVRALGELVRLEPRAMTAKAVLDRVRSYVINATDEFHHDWLDEIARDFEASS